MKAAQLRLLGNKAPMFSVNFVRILILCVVIFPAHAYKTTTSRIGVGTRNFLKLSAGSHDRGSPPKVFDPLNIGSSVVNTQPHPLSSKISATVAASALLIPTQDAFAKGGEYGILEGRTGSMAHPITMFALFGTSIYSAYLGLKYRELRTIGDVSFLHSLPCFHCHDSTLYFLHIMFVFSYLHSSYALT